LKFDSRVDDAFLILDGPCQAIRVGEDDLPR
jgi:hypothetical protein